MKFFQHVFIFLAVFTILKAEQEKAKMQSGSTFDDLSGPEAAKVLQQVNGINK